MDAPKLPPIDVAKFKRKRVSRSEDPLESTIERAVCRYAKERMLLPYKFTSPGRVSVPDQIFLSWDQRCFFIEFKRKGKKPTPKQLLEHQKLRDKGHTVYVVDNIDQGKLVIDLWLSQNR